jgi:hypothetical protein
MNLIKKIYELQAEISNLDIGNNSDNNIVIDAMKKYKSINNEYQKQCAIFTELKKSYTCLEKIMELSLQQFCRVSNILSQERLSDLDIKTLQNYKTFQLTPNITIPLITVPDESFISNSNIYYNQETEKVCIKIMGKIISGHGLLDVITNDNKTNYNPTTSLKNTSWLHTDRPWTKSNRHMRHITINKINEKLMNDELCRREKIIREKQFIHDLLIYLLIVFTSE